MKINGTNKPTPSGHRFTKLVDSHGNPIEKSPTRDYRGNALGLVYGAIYGYGGGYLDNGPLDQLPPFSRYMIEIMRQEGLARFAMSMVKAPYAAAGTPIDENDTEGGYVGYKVEADNPEVKEDIEKAISKIWQCGASKILKSIDYGQVGVEIEWKIKNGRYEVEGVKGFDPADASALIRKRTGKVAGLRVRRVPKEKDGQAGVVDLVNGRGLWAIHNQIDGTYIGIPLHLHAYPFWWELWHHRGAIHSRREWAMNNAYGGRTATFIPQWLGEEFGFTNEIHSGEIAAQLVELGSNGSGYTIPMIKDETSGEWRPMVEVSDPKTFGEGTGVLEYPERLATEVMRGYGIPDNLIQSTLNDATGTYGGRAISFEAFLSTRQEFWKDILGAIDRQVIKHMVRWNHGRVGYEITPTELMPASDKKEDQQQGGFPFGGPGGNPFDPNGNGNGGQPFQGGGPGDALDQNNGEREDDRERRKFDQMSAEEYIEAAVGRGVLKSSAVVEAKQAADDAIKRMADEGRWITIGGHQEGDKQHADGTAVYIGPDGTIKAGPAALEGRNLNNLDQDKQGDTDGGQPKPPELTQDLFNDAVDSLDKPVSNREKFQRYRVKQNVEKYLGQGQSIDNAVDNALEVSSLSDAQKEHIRNQLKGTEPPEPEPEPGDEDLPPEPGDDPIDESDQEKTGREARENWSNVMDDPEAASTDNLRRAIVYGDQMRRAYQSAEQPDAAEAIQEELNNIKRILKDRELADWEEDPDKFELDTGDPRKDAGNKAELDDDYEFARKSAIGNRGEDLKDSARHKANEWRTLEDAEADGKGDQFATRKFLEKNSPHNLMAGIDEVPQKSLSALAMHLALKKYPPKPGYRGGEVGEKERKQYVDTYERLKEKAEYLAVKHVDPQEALEAFRHEISDAIDELRESPGSDMISQSAAKDRYNQTANSLINLYNSLGWKGRRQKNSPIRQVAQFANDLAAAEPDIEPGNAGETAAEYVRRVLEGESMSKVFGKESEGGKPTYFKPADVYVNNKARREGGRDISANTTTANQAADYMMDNFKLRGLQWGNSVTDDERAHHAGKAAEALADLADVLGLDDSDVSMNGGLGLAIGARGKGTALAHYEPSSQVINLTRKKGVGSFAHEWGHFFDHHLGGHEITTGRKPEARFQSQSIGGMDKSPVGRAMAEVRKAMRESGFDQRLDNVVREMVENKLLPRDPGYWKSPEEKFARSFERHVAAKLKASGQENTYLAGAKDHALWPNEQETAAIGTAIDGLIEAFKGQKTERMSYKAGWKKVGGASVYVSAEGEIEKGCPGLKGENIDDITDESDASRAERDRRQELAEEQGYDGEDLTKEQAQKLAPTKRGELKKYGYSNKPENFDELDEDKKKAWYEGQSQEVDERDKEFAKALTKAGILSKPLYELTYDQAAAIKDIKAKKKAKKKYIQDYSRSLNWTEETYGKDSDQYREAKEKFDKGLERYLGWTSDYLQYDTWKDAVKKAILGGKDVPQHIRKDFAWNDWFPKELKDKEETRSSIKQYKNAARDPKRKRQAQKIMEKVKAKHSTLDRVRKSILGLDNHPAVQKKQQEYEAARGKDREAWDIYWNKMSELKTERYPDVKWTSDLSDEQRKDIDSDPEVVRLKGEYDQSIADTREAYEEVKHERRMLVANAISNHYGGNSKSNLTLEYDQDWSDSGRALDPKTTAFLQLAVNGKIFDDGIHTVQVKSTDRRRSFASGTSINQSPGAGAVTEVHEIGHTIEHAMDHKIGEMSKAWLINRARRRGFRHCGSGYENHEVTLKGDDFTKDPKNSFTGDNYTHKYYAGKGSTEILSMGLQGLYDDPIEFAKRDPGHFRWTVGIITGELLDD